MIRASGVNLVLLDATVPHRFCEAQMLPQLIKYLNTNAQVTPEVDGELKNSSRWDDFAGLRLLQHVGWPKVTDPLPQHLRSDYEHYRRAVQQPGDPPTKHIGEITTVMMAEHLRADLVIMDDEFGKRLAKKKGLARISTAQLVVEMTVHGALNEGEGLAAFNLASGGAGEAAYQARLTERRFADGV